MKNFSNREYFFLSPPKTSKIVKKGDPFFTQEFRHFFDISEGFSHFFDQKSLFFANDPKTVFFEDFDPPPKKKIPDHRKKNYPIPTVCDLKLKRGVFLIQMWVNGPPM